MMRTFERTRDIRHDIGSNGELSLRTLDGPVRLRGVDGGEARVHVMFAVRAADETAADRAVDSGWLRVETLPGRLSVAVPDGARGGLDALLRFIGTGERVRVAFDVEVPRSATVTIDAVSGDVEAEGLAGIQRYRSVSGRIRVRDAGGPVSIAGTSGDVAVEGGRPMALDVATVSGVLRVAVPLLESLQVRSVSGDFDIRAALAERGDHRVDTVSGRLRLAAAGGLTVETHGISGSVRCEVPHRLEGQAGRQVLVVGDGAAHVRFDSMSGDVWVTAAPVPANGAASPSTGGAAGATATAAGAAAGSDSTTSHDTPPGATAEGWGSPMFQVWHDRAYERMDDLRSEAASERAVHGDRFVGGDTAVTGTTADGVPAPDSRLEILRALERGDIDVDEAARRLATLDAADRAATGSTGTAVPAWQGVPHAG